MLRRRRARYITVNWEMSGPRRQEIAGRLQPFRQYLRELAGDEMTLRTSCRVALALGVLSAVAVLTALLALQDIYHGEGDLALEWRVVRVSSLVVLVFHAFALTTAAWKDAGFPIGTTRLCEGYDCPP